MQVGSEPKVYEKQQTATPAPETAQEAPSAPETAATKQRQKATGATKLLQLPTGRGPGSIKRGAASKSDAKSSSKSNPTGSDWGTAKTPEEQFQAIIEQSNKIDKIAQEQVESLKRDLKDNKFNPEKSLSYSKRIDEETNKLIQGLSALGPIIGQIAKGHAKAKKSPDASPSDNKIDSKAKYWSPREIKSREIQRNIQESLDKQLKEMEERMKEQGKALLRA